MTDLIAEYLEHFATNHAASSVDTYGDVLRRMDRDLPYGVVSACEDELKEWIYSDSHGLAHRKLCRVIVNSFYEWACNPHDPRLDLNPAAALPLVTVPAGRPKPVAEPTKFDLLARADRPYRDWFLIACMTGARCTELANLDREHIGQEWTLLHGKGNKLRRVPTLPVVWALAQQLPAGAVCTDRRGVRLTRQQVSHRGNYHLQKVLGLTGVHMHRLRSTFGTEAYAATKDIMAVMTLLGHASPATTRIYVGVADEALSAAVAGLRAA
jgi:integrase/recombinase XerC